MPVPGVMQTVQRAEFWCAIVAMQAYWPCHLGIDNLNVARTLGRLFDRDSLVRPLPSVKDGDLIALARYMIRTRGRETVRVTKVTRHADDVDVQQGRVRLEDQVGNTEADTAADFGRRYQSEVLIDARRRLLKARSHWYPIMLDLHRFMVTIARVSVNHDGRSGTAPDPVVWDQGSRPKARKLAICKEYTSYWLRKRYKYTKKNYKSTEDKHETNHINNKYNDMNMNTRKMHNT